MRRAAFTLVELLVVIAVIGLLASLLLAGAHRVREQADVARCLHNLRQWSVALTAYATDHDGETPRRGQGVRPVTKIQKPEDWFNALPPYAGLPAYRDLPQRIRPGDGTIFACPRAQDPGAFAFLPYAMNRELSPTDRQSPHRLAEIPEPAKVVFMADAPGPYSSTIASDGPDSVVARHGGRANVVFLDGHAVSFDAAYIGAGTGDPQRADIHWDPQSPWTD
ncbi:MAG: prepilin-type N-terminal cleavage/methylation domain-containing protein [Chthoniobacteraceae bacterium]